MLKVVVIDDHPLLRAGVAAAVREASRFVTIEEASAVDLALASLARSGGHPLFILKLPADGGDWSSGLRAIRSRYAAAPVLTYAAEEDGRTAHDAVAQGATGFLSKSLPFEQVVEMLSGFLEAEEEHADAGEAARLTPAQREVLRRLKIGLLNKQIAYELGIAEATVKTHVSAIFRKLQVNNRTQAVLIATGARDDAGRGAGMGKMLRVEAA